MISLFANKFHSPIRQIASTAALLSIPVAPLAASPEAPFMWLGRVAILLALACSVVLLPIKRCDRPSLLILAVFGLLICVGFVGNGSGNSQRYVQIAQLVIVGFVLAAPKHLRLTGGLTIALLGLIAAAVAINFIWPAAALQDDTHRFSQGVGIFGNPNTLAINWMILFVLTASIAWHTTAAFRAAALFLCLGLAYLTVSTGSRGALLAMLSFAVVIAAGTMVRGNKAWLHAAGAAAIISVPTILFAYPTMMGVPIHFKLSPAAQAQLARHDNITEPIKDAPSLLDKPTCVPSTFQKCFTEAPKPPGAVVYGAMEDAGFLGINKSLASGRERIWPSVIELSGETMFFGHGLGTLPGAYLAWPDNGRSAHNGFLQVYFQFGLIGLFLYFSAWALLFYRAADIVDVAARTSAIAITVAACVTETFEVVMNQNQLGMGIGFALLMTVRLLSSPALLDTSDRTPHV